MIKTFGTHNYFVYITTNINKNVFYTGVSNDITRRLQEHEADAETLKKHFTGKYNCYYLIYWERYESIEMAIARETQIKTWSRLKKMNLIKAENPNWKFLNEEVGHTLAAVPKEGGI